MNKRAWAFIWGTYAVAALLALQAVLGEHQTHPEWLAVEVLFGLAIGAQLFKVEAPNHVLFYATPIFFFAGTILLGPRLLLFLIISAHVAEWVKERWAGSSYLKAWYLQPFNIAMFWIASRAAQGVYAVLHDRAASGSGWELAAIMAGALVYVVFNHAFLGIALMLARGVSWAESGILDGASFVSDFALLCVGCIVAILWTTKPWFVLPALTPVAFMYQALMIPQLKREAETDAKTGLFNARHFGELFSAELDRAQRFDRPLAVIMADLDHLREVNNTHGHLAGDAVLAGVAKVIHSTVRDYDSAARFGGEEFALLLPEVDEEHAQALAERLRRAIESATFPVTTSSTPLRVTMSLGVACFPFDGHTTTELLHAADKAVYAAKASGRNRVICTSEIGEFDPVPVELPQSLSSGLEPLTERATQPITTSGQPVSSSSPPVASSSPPVASSSQPISSPGFTLSPVMQHSPVTTGETQSESPSLRSWVQTLFVSSVIVTGMVAVVIGLLGSRGASPAVVGLLTLLGALAELLEVDLLGQGTVSISVGIAFTAALLTGVEGLACVSAVIAIVHHMRQRRGFTQLYRAVFNWSVHMLGGLVVVAVMLPQHVSLQTDHLALLAPTALAAALGYFIVETGLVAAAVALARPTIRSQAGAPLLPIWKAHYMWLLPHYIVLCLMGLALSVTYAQIGIMGVLIFALPLLMMHVVQRQYVIQSRENVQSLQRLNRDLVRAALHDHLTGLGNERGFQEVLRREAVAASERGLPLAIARFNVDDFRAINEETGRRHGDGVLVEIAQMLTAAPALHQAFRLVADDFAVILPNTTFTEAVSFLDRFRDGAPGRLAGTTLSVGIAATNARASVPNTGQPESGADALDVDVLNEQALRALSEAKRRGRNTTVGFDEIRDSTLVASWAQAQAVRRLLSEQKIDVAFQPIWDIDRGTILGFEALARPAPEYGLVGPQEAFDVATRIGRARELDTVCREAILARAHELPTGARLFVNLAPESLERGGVSCLELVDAVEKAGLRTEQVVLELTERSIIRPDTVVRRAHELRTYGFAFALDDTGSGNAGLGVLSQLQVDYVKVDRSVVSLASTDQAARAVLAGIFALAHEMGAYVIAEGIETIGMLELVRDMSRSLAAAHPASSSSQIHGGRGVQGFLLGAPSIAPLNTPDTGGHLRSLPLIRLGREIANAFPIAGEGPEPVAVGW